MAQEEVEIYFVRASPWASIGIRDGGGKGAATMGATFGLLKLCLSLVRRELSSRTPKVRRLPTITQPRQIQRVRLYFSGWMDECFGREAPAEGGAEADYSPWLATSSSGASGATEARRSSRDGHPATVPLPRTGR